jgi:hypothetical protein
MLRTALMVVAILAASARLAIAQPVPLYTDVAVTLGATPTRNLSTGDTITFTTTITNNGPVAVGYVAIIGPQIFSEFYNPTSAWNDCGLMTTTGDSEFGPFWVIEWFPDGLGEAPLAVGETRTCHFTLAVAPAFPGTYSFTMMLPDYWSDIDPGNDQATVILSRAITTVPMLDRWVFMMLGALVAIFGSIVSRPPAHVLSANTACGRRRLASSDAAATRRCASSVGQAPATSG